MHIRMLLATALAPPMMTATASATSLTDAESPGLHDPSVFAQ